MIFLDDRMRISDNSKFIHLVTFALLISACILGISYLIDNSAANEPTLFYMGVLIVLSSGFAIIFMLTRTVSRELLYSDIQRIILKKNYNGDIIANVKLKKGRIRYIAMNSSQQDYDSFLNKVEEHQIYSEFKNLLPNSRKKFELTDID